MPYVACEAIACGAIAIVSDGGSIPFWHNRFAGVNPGAVVVPQRDYVLLRQTITTLLADESQRQAISNAGRAWVTEHLSSPVIAVRLLDLLLK